VYCPDCRAEYQDGVRRCADCDKNLVQELAPVAAEELQWQDTGVVFETNDPTAMIVAKSILEGAEIPFVSVGDHSQDLIGVGRIFAGSNPLLGQMRIEVPREYQRWAQRILQPLTQSGIRHED
jgi:hypothetical protein